MKQLVFLRHGQTTANQEGKVQGVSVNLPLNPEGIAQIKTTCQYLLSHSFHFDALVSSPLSRALQSALIVTEYGLSETPIWISALCSERNYGDFEGCPVADFLSLAHKSEQAIELDHQLESRAKGFVHQLLTQEGEPSSPLPIQTLLKRS